MTVMSSASFRVISIGTLAANPHWGERGAVRPPHATTSLIVSGKAKILVDPSLPAQALVPRLVERAGIGRRRIFLPMLEFGKRPPSYETDGTRVTLRIFDGVFDERMAALVAKWRHEGVELDLEGLLVLFYLRDHAFIDATHAAEILQLERDQARGVLDSLTIPPAAMLERRGRTKAVTYHLAKGLASDLHGKAAYSAGRGINPLRYAELIKVFLQDHQEITPKQCRELLHLGESQSARVEISRLLRKWSGPEGFLDRNGEPPKVTYRLRSDG